jgi:hypothetical protein
MNATRISTLRQGATTAGIVLLGATALGGCVYRTHTTAPAPAASPATTTVVVTSPAGQRVISYPSGRYELYGDGAATPYYWVWVPAGSALPAPPPPPAIPR